MERQKDLTYVALRKDGEARRLPYALTSRNDGKAKRLPYVLSSYGTMERQKDYYNTHVILSDLAGLDTNDIAH